MSRTRVQPHIIYPERRRYVGTYITSIDYLSGGWHSPLVETYTHHKCIDETHPGPPFKTGGPLDILKHIYPTPGINHSPSTWKTAGIYEYRTGFENLVPLRKFYGITDINESLLGWSNAELIGLGTEGWKRATYLRPNLDLNQTIGEMRDLRKQFVNVHRSLKNLFHSAAYAGGVKNAKTIMKELSSGYLTWEFGISPILSDLRSLRTAHEHAEKRIKHLKRMSGRGAKHRRVDLLDDTFSDAWSGTISVQPITPTVPSQNMVDNAANYPRTEEVVRTRKLWLEGKFGYYIPVVDSPEWRHRMLIRQGYGIDLSTIGLLRTLYQLTPWSWLADWALSTGDILANMVSIHHYGAYSEYAYIMGEDKCVYNTTYELRPQTGGTIPVPGTFISVRKQRLAASPFGFGLTFQNLSNWQLSILAALGLSKFG